MTTETRYMRSDTHIINTKNTYKLSTTQNASYVTVAISNYVGNITQMQYIGIKVYKVAENGDETLLEDMGAIASGSSTATISATIDVSEAALVSTDAIMIRVYGNDFTPPTTLLATFITEQIGASKLTAVTWTVYYYLYRYYNSGLGETTYYIRFGTTTYNSRITNFQWTATVVPTVTTEAASGVGRD